MWGLEKLSSVKIHWVLEFGACMNMKEKSFMKRGGQSERVLLLALDLLNWNFSTMLLLLLLLESDFNNRTGNQNNLGFAMKKNGWKSCWRISFETMKIYYSVENFCHGISSRTRSTLCNIFFLIRKALLAALTIRCLCKVCDMLGLTCPYWMPTQLVSTRDVAAPPTTKPRVLPK